ncbi:hypothetical protein BDV97DRAFT_355553 [Delphinella strobiligena]|nr:hypothetical protein BDV97DRAFT_355553 [Delphinella strobiligena]
MATETDLKEIWSWNAFVPEAVETCVHDIIVSVAHKQKPETLAIDAWDGRLTYQQLDQLSERLSQQLVAHGVGPNTIVPLCFEKSKWMPVAMLAVMRAGGASVAIDMSLPRARLQAILAEVKPEVVLTSPTNSALCSSLSKIPTLVVNQDLLYSIPGDRPSSPSPSVKPSDLLYVVFTSGSTGTPKGAMITHSNFASALRYQQPMYFRGARVYDFTSHSFDLLWMNFGATLTCGGCLCIPSDEERKDNIVSSMNKFEVTAATFTPTLARTFKPNSIPSLRTVILGGEALEQSDYDAWSPFVDLKNAYGPSECTPATTCLSMGQTSELLGAIGPALGMRAWVVNVESDTLQPVGEVGELWLEGPCVGKGYLNDPEKTTAAFVKNPPWLISGAPGASGRQGCLYKTGDLVRYGKNGILFYHGRKDAQVKIRGQRVEFGEVEHHVRAALLERNYAAKIVAEVITPAKTKNPRLVVFLGPIAPATSLARVNIEDLNEQLTALLPSYMIPWEYITLEDIPLMPSDKTDRRRLRDLGASLTMEQLASHAQKQMKPSTPAEKHLQAFWATVLELDPSTIGAEDSFLRIGGDSIQAMRLVTVARKQGFSLKVAEIFEHPRLCDQAKLLEANTDVQEVRTIAPFSLLKPGLDKETVRKQAALLANVDPARVQDIFPCTPLQEGLLALTVKRAGDYTSQAVFHLLPGTDEDTFKKACTVLVETTPILRTRIIDLPSQGLVQIVVDEPPRWVDSDPVTPIGLGTPLTSFRLAKDDNQSGTTFVWTLHHAVYDGWSISLMLSSLEAVYHQETPPSLTPFRHFVEHIIQLDGPSTDEFWRSQLGDSVPAVYPQHSTPSYQPQGDGTLAHVINDLLWPNSDITPSTCIRTSWAILQAYHTGSNNIVFGATVTGRQAAVAGIEEIAGPAIAIVPVHVQLDWDQDVDQMTKKVQKQAVDMIPFEQTGLQRIRRISESAKEACQFQTLLVVQPAMYESRKSRLFDWKQTDNGLDNVSKTYALKLECQLQENGVKLYVNYDSTIIETSQIQRLVTQLEHILRQICSESFFTRRLRDVEVTTTQDLKDIWTWNASLADSEEILVHDLFREAVIRNPEGLAVHAWDGKFTYQRLDELSTQLADQLMALGVGPNSMISLGFEKSKWTVVSILAVMKAGGASVLMDMAQPEERLSSIIAQVQPRVVLTSSLNETLVNRLSPNIAALIVNQESMRRLSQDRNYKSADSSPEPRPSVKPSDLLYVVFTSGSTGTPKGVMISHANFSSGIKHQRSLMGIDSESRTFDFSSYLFDISWTTHLHTLTAGGCLCIPSDYEKQNRLREAVQEYEATIINVTPSVAQSFQLDTVKTLKRLVLSGEKVTSNHIQSLTGNATTVITYGTAECTVKATFVQAKEDKTLLRTIGKGYGINTWLVDQNDHTKLAPIGAVGEICIEGPLVGRGYLADLKGTAAAFIQDPPWLTRGGITSGRLGTVYKTGDLARYREDGLLVYIGRKDAQVKIRGQRVELGDVEYHVRRALSDANPEVLAEVLTPKESRNSILVAFVCPTAATSTMGDDELRTITVEITKGVEGKLTTALPPYMIPSAYIPIRKIPMGVTGKIDRRKLRELGNAMTIDQIKACNSSQSEALRRNPSTEIEQRLQALWARVLSIDAASIGADDNFFRLGGDSIAAMRLVRAAQDEHMSNQFLSDSTIADPKPFSLLQPNRPAEELLRAIAPSVEFSIESVQDMYPLPHTQARLVYLATQEPPQGCVFSYVDLSADISLERLKKTVVDLWDHLDVLRTAHIQHQERIWQIIARGVPVPLDLYEVPEKEVSSVFSERTLRKSLECPLKLGEIYSKFAIFHRVGTPSRLAIRMSHAQYDGLSLQTIARCIGDSLKRQKMPDMASYASYVKHCMDNDRTTKTFYKSLLKDSRPLLPMIGAQLTGVKRRDIGNVVLHKTRSVPEPRKIDGITPATVFFAVSAYVLAKQRKTADVVLSLMVSGRAALPPRMHNVVGALINLIPCRVRIAEGEQLEEILRSVQDQRLHGINYEACTMSDTLMTCVDWPQEQRKHGVTLQWHTLEKMATLEDNGRGPHLQGFGGEDVWKHSEDIFIRAEPQNGMWDIYVAGMASFCAESHLDEVLDGMAKVLQSL